MGYRGDTGAETASSELSRFAFNGLKLLRDIEYRPMHSSDDLEQLFRFRYDCYRGKGYIDPNRKRMSFDALDADPNVFRFGVFLGDRLVSSVRLQHLTSSKRLGPSMLTYPDVVGPMLDRGLTMIDPSRLTINDDLSSEYPLLPYLTIRLAVIATIHFNVDYCLACVRPSHGAFYRRVFQSTQLHGERAYNNMHFPVFLYAADAEKTRARMLRRYPFFHSLPHEREMLFDGDGTAASKPLTILPTAELALAA